MNQVNKMWTEIERALSRLALSYEKVRLYQDGLPVCGREVDIVTELAKSGSRNHQLLLRLKEKGATIMGTESSELLLEEYQLLKRILATKDPQEAAKLEAHKEELSRSILERRDQYIANRINSTLHPDETGILFLGMLHTLEDRLDEDIRVIYPIYQPFDRRGKRV